MNSNLNTVVEQINVLLERNLRPGSHEVLHSYMEVLNATEGTDEEKLQHLSREITRQVMDIISKGNNPTDIEINAMAFHTFFTEIIGSILESVWAEKVTSSAKA